MVTRIKIEVRIFRDEVHIHVEKNGRFFDEVEFHVSEFDCIANYISNVLLEAMRDD